ncbi:FAD-binding oxidoreductase [Pseudonocardia alaniniphila]
MFRPGDREFDEETSGFQTAYKHRPAYVVAATGADDVRKALTGAGGLPVAVQATGHGRTVPLDGGVLISTRRMTGLRVDPGRRSAWIEAGVRWQQVITAAAEHGLAPLSGSAPEVGVVGYILGGGLGVLARRYGYAADHVSSIDVAAADGSLRHVTADDDPDLFRELRGAGHGLGVVTAMEIGLVPVTRLYGGGLYVDSPHVPELLEVYRDWTADLPDELTSSVALIPYPDMAGVPELLRGRYAAHVRIAFAGPTAQGERLVAPLRAAVPLLRDTLAELPFTQSASIYNDPAWPHSYGGTNAMLRELDPTVLRDIVELAGPGAPVPCIVQLNHMGGALARPPAVPNAVGHRDAAYLVRVLSVLGDPAAASRAHGRLLDALAPWTVGRSRNFLFGQPWADQAGAVVSGTA